MANHPYLYYFANLLAICGYLFLAQHEQLCLTLPVARAAEVMPVLIGGHIAQHLLLMIINRPSCL